LAQPSLSLDFKTRVKRSAIGSFLYFLILLLFFSPYAQADELQKLFDEALILYRNRQFEPAKLKFMAAVAEPSLNPRITANYLMLAKTYEKLGDFEEAIIYANTIIEKYPDSRYVGDAYFVIATADYKQGRIYEALDNFLFVIESTSEKELIGLAEKLANQVVEHSISAQALEALYRNHSSPAARAWITLWQIKASYAGGKKAEGDALVLDFFASNPESRFAKAANQLKQMDVEAIAKSVRIGVLLPLSGFFSAEAKELLRGMAYALKERQTRTPKIEMVVRDSKGSMVDAILGMEMLLQEDIAIAIGELEGTKSAAVASLASQAGLPMIIPVATDNGLTSLGPMVFQANSDLETRGEALAQYAFDQLHMRTFATLAPTDDYGHALADAFTNTVDRLGGTIISQQWYYPGTQDFKRHFVSIRTAAIRSSFRDSLLTRGTSTLPARLDSIYNALDRRAIAHSEEREGLAETTEIPITSIDGIFFPAYEEDLSYIVPQFALYNIQARPLGGEYWLNEEELRSQRQYINGVVFIASNYTNELDTRFREFRNKFRQTTTTSPGAMTLYGYNLMRLLIQDIDAGNLDGSRIAAYLGKVEHFTGIGGNISFASKSRVNNSITLLQFQDGNIFKLTNR
jgi:ABC-type branched-subunit amino acid transport system substrate-binding protein